MSDAPKIVVASVMKIARAKLRSRYGGGGGHMGGGGICPGIGPCIGGTQPPRAPGGGTGANAPRGSIGGWPGGGCCSAMRYIPLQQFPHLSRLERRNEA